MKRKFNINPARQTNGNLCNKSMLRRKCRYFKAFRFPPSLFHRVPLPNSFVLNINYFPTTLEMLSAVNLPTSRKNKKQQYTYPFFKGWYVKFQQKKKNLLASVRYYIPVSSIVRVRLSSSVCNTERWTSGFLRHAPMNLSLRLFIEHLWNHLCPRNGKLWFSFFF